MINIRVEAHDETGQSTLRGPADAWRALLRHRLFRNHAESAAARVAIEAALTGSAGDPVIVVVAADGARCIVGCAAEINASA